MVRINRMWFKGSPTTRTPKTDSKTDNYKRIIKWEQQQLRDMRISVEHFRLEVRADGLSGSRWLLQQTLVLKATFAGKTFNVWKLGSMLGGCSKQYLPPVSDTCCCAFHPPLLR
jgi:hypothetical protein